MLRIAKEVGIDDWWGEHDLRKQMRQAAGDVLTPDRIGRLQAARSAIDEILQAVTNQQLKGNP